MEPRQDQRQTASLRFRVIATSIHPEWFTVKAHRRIEGSTWRADLRIVEGGHLVCWRFGPIMLTELLVPEDLPLPELPSLCCGSTRHAATYEFQRRPAQYHAHLEAEHLDDETFEHIQTELTLDAKRAGIAAHHRTVNRLETSPLSLLQFETLPSGLAVQAYHTLPDQNLIIRAQSLFEFLPSGSPAGR